MTYFKVEKKLEGNISMIYLLGVILKYLMRKITFIYSFKAQILQKKAPFCANTSKTVTLIKTIFYFRFKINLVS